MGAPLFAQLTSCPLEGIVHRLDGMVQYDQTHATDSGSVTVRVKGTPGQHEVTVSVDGNASTSTYTFS